MQTKSQAFSLIELSIVLVILGLLTGGILTGQNLIRAAELRSITTELQAYQTAVHTFRDKYFALPGDLPNATDFWGEADADPATCATTTPTGTETCNGDGNGNIYHTGTGSNTSHEYMRFWQHLANAGLINGSYTGVFVANTGTPSTPSSKFNTGQWHVAYSNGYNRDANTNAYDFVTPGTAMDFLVKDRHHFIMSKPTLGHSLGRAPSPADGESWPPLFLPEEAWNIDKKIDDGLPAGGKVVARWWDDCTDATAADDDNAQYLLADSSIQCSLHFISAF